MSFFEISLPIWNAYLEILPGGGLAFPFLPEHCGSQNLQ